MSEDCPKQKKGAPDWMVTFSDLMTLLLTFFVLLLSTAEIDSRKFERGSRSVRDALSGREPYEGRELIGEQLHKFVAVESPVPLAELIRSMQRTLTIIQRKLIDKETQEEELTEMERQELEEQVDQLVNDIESMKEAIDPQYAKNPTMTEDEFKELVKQIGQCLTEEIQDGSLRMETYDKRIMIEYPEETTFESGSDRINPKMVASIMRLAEVLKNFNTYIIVSGYTDDVPINTEVFRSNWDLSARRAVSVAHELIKFGEFKAEQVEVVGHADGYPIVPNNSPQNRSINRRVELLIDPASFGPSRSVLTRKSIDY